MIPASDDLPLTVCVNRQLIGVRVPDACAADGTRTSLKEKTLDPSSVRRAVTWSFIENGVCSCCWWLMASRSRMKVLIYQSYRRLFKTSKATGRIGTAGRHLLAVLPAQTELNLAVSPHRNSIAHRQT